VLGGAFERRAAGQGGGKEAVAAFEYEVVGLERAALDEGVDTQEFEGALR